MEGLSFLAVRGARASRRTSARITVACSEPLERRTLLSTDVLTWHYSTARTGANTAETVLTPSNVNTSAFGKLASFPVDGYVYAQPLVRQGVSVPGFGTRDLLLVATEHDSVYAFDATGNNPAAGYLWKRSFLTGPSGTTVTTVPYQDVGINDIVPEIGITGTPVIDPATNTLYVVVKTKETTSGTTRYVQRLHALDITTGNETAGGPVEITATVPGTGEGGSSITFNPLRQHQRAALVLANGNVYIAWASHGDNTPYHGWVIGYNASNIQQRTSAWATTPDGMMAGVWMAGGGISADASGNLYVTSGNGSFDANTGGRNYGDSLVKLTSGLSVADSFTPRNQADLNTTDQDFGVSVAMLLPDQAGPYPHEILTADKTGRLYLLNRDNLGGYSSTANNSISEVAPSSVTLHNNLAYWNGRVYVGYDGGHLTAYPINNGVFGSVQSTSPETFGTYDSNGSGCSPLVSSNGASSAIVWISDNTGYSSSSPAVIRAYDATNLGTELWSSSQASGGRDTAAPAVKFTSPVIANGYVYLGGQNAVTMYGLLSSPPIPPSGPTVQVPLSSSFNRIGAYSDGTTFPSNQGLDRVGNALSANLLGTTRSWNSLTFMIGPANAANVVQGGTAVTIPLPQGNYSNLAMLATATNGNQAGQTFTVRYTDGTTQTITQGISDWYTPQSYAGEADAITMAYRNTSSGGRDSRTFHVYGYTFTLNSAKTAQSITLPANANVMVLAMTLTGSSVVVTPPAAPTGISATANGSSEIDLSWTAPSGPVDSYTIYRSTTPGGEGTTPYRTGITTTSFADTGLAASTTYYYTVAAVNSAGTSPQSTETSATTTSIPAGGSTPVPLTSAFNQTGIYADGATFASSGGLDRSGSALSATLLGSNITWGGSTFTLGPAGASDVVHGGAGVVINLPATQSSSLQLLALAVNGNQPTQTFTLRYADGTTQTITQGISDWHTPQSYSGESVAVPMAYRNTSSGGRDSRSFYVYGYTFTLNPAKTLQSLALPSNINVIVLAANLAGAPTSIPSTPTGLSASAASSSQINLSWNAAAGASSYDIYRSTTPGGEGATPYRTGITATTFSDTGLSATTTYYYTVAARNSLGASSPSAEVSATTLAPSTVVQVALTSYFNRAGMYTDGSTFPTSGGLDLWGNALSATLLGTSVLWNGKTFTLGPANAPNIVNNGATIALPAGQYASLSLLATATNGNQAGQTFTVRYTDGTTQTITQSISDWYTAQNYSGEATAVTMPYRNTATGGRDSRTFRVYGYTFALNPAKTVQSISLPANINVQVLAIDLG